MANYSTTSDEITSIANAIRASSEKTGSLLYPTEFVTEINKLHALGIIVTSEPGITVSATDGSDTYPGTETSSGIYEIPVPDYGTYTINVTKGNKTTTAQIVVQKTPAEVYPTFTIRFLDSNGSTLLQSVEVRENVMPEYPGGHPKKRGYVFDHWVPALTEATQDADYTAIFNESITHKYLNRNLTGDIVVNVPKIRHNAFRQNSGLTSVETNASVIGMNAFGYCSNLKTIKLTNTGSIKFIYTDALTSCSELNAFIIYSSSLPSGELNFDATRFAGHDGGIYVPANLVSSYKSQTGSWSQYADMIYPLESYPVTDKSTITDSWETIFANESNGTYASKYSVGDIKQFDSDDGHSYQMEIIAMDTDVLSDNTGYAKITWMTRWVYRIYSIGSNGESVSWPNCTGRTTLQGVMTHFPTIIQNNIKAVNKTSIGHTGITETSSDKIWAPSTRELNISATTNYAVEDSGVQYAYLNTNAIRKRSESIYYWLRSASTKSNETTQYRYITSTGACPSSALTVASGQHMVFGFCT